MSTARRVPLGVITFECESATVAEGSLLVVGAADNAVKLPAAADPGIAVGLVGFAAFALTGTAGPVDVIVSGIAAARAGAAITAGTLLTVDDTTGALKTAAPGGGTNVACIGVALADAADGDRFPVLIQPCILQG